MVASLLAVLGTTAVFSLQRNVPRTDTLRGARLFHDEFDRHSLNEQLWRWGQKAEGARPAPGRGVYRVEQNGGQLILTAQAEHDTGWTSTQHTWVSSLVDLRGRGDVIVETVLSGGATNAFLSCIVSDGTEPAGRENTNSVALFEVHGGNHVPAELQAVRLRIEFIDSAGLAIVRYGPVSKIIDISQLQTWKLRYSVYAHSSAGFRTGSAVLIVNSATAVRSRQETRLIGSVIDKISGRPVAGAEIRNATGSRLGITDASGNFSVATSKGPLRIGAFNKGFAEPGLLNVSVESGRSKLVNLTVRRNEIGFGDVVSSIAFGERDIPVIEATADGIYYADYKSLHIVDEHTRFPKLHLMDFSGTVLKELGYAIYPQGLARGDEGLCSTTHWPGRIFRYDDRGPELLAEMRYARPNGVELKVNWPRDAACANGKLWFVENAEVEDRHGLFAFDLRTRTMVAHLPTRERKIAGLAWDGRNFWISTDAGRVFEMNPEMALSQGSVEGGIGREFTGFYARLSYFDGYLWGLDTETRRICKINISD